MTFIRLILLCFIFIQSVQAEKITYQIPRVAQSPTIDGQINAIEWANATQVELGYNVDPGDSVQAPVKTIAYMMEDGENIYFAFYASDPDPEKILAYIRERDGIFQDDFVGVIIDTFNDERKGFEFFVNPMGSQGDLTRDDNLNNEDFSWNTVWDSAGKLLDDGYSVEMSIPFRALRFTSGLSEQQWGIQFLRIYPRDSRMLITDNPNDRKLDCTLCQVNKVVGMPELQSTGVNLDITPTLTYVNNQSRETNPLSAWEDGANNPEFGADMRWAMSEDWILNATLNPDFSQVEADSGQLDINTTFSLFYPEARPFFLDGADYFDGMNTLVHTRNIADPDYGVKVTGKTNGHSAGAIVASDESTSFLVPSSLGSYVVNLEEQQSEIIVMRGQTDIGKKNNIGVLVTHRKSEDYKNEVFAIDGKYYLNEKDVFSYQLMHSDSTNPESIRFDEDTNDELLAKKQIDHAISLGYRHNEKNYVLRANYNDFGKDFRADMGFVSQVDYKKLILGGEYFWYGEKSNKWTRWGFFGDWDRTEDQSGKKLEEEFELHMNVRGPMQFNTNFGLVSRKRFYDDIYFNEDLFMMYFEFKPFSNLKVGNFMQLGDQIDFTHSQPGKIRLFEPFINWQIGKHIDVNLNYTNNLLKVDAGELFLAELIDLRLAYQFSVRSRLSLTLQSSNIHRNIALYADNQDLDFENDVLAKSKNIGTQLIYSYKINPQSLIYIGYSDKAVQNDEVQSVTKEDKTFFAKFSYMWQH